MSIGFQPAVSPEVLQSLDALEKHRAECQKNGKYEEAEMAKVQRKQLKEQEEMRVCEDLHNQHLASLLGVEEAHAQEFQVFNEAWDEKVAEYDAHANALQQTLLERQHADHEKYMVKLSKDVEPKRPSWSSELLNRRKIQDTLGKQKKYTEASAMKSKVDALEEQERAAWMMKREAKIAGLEEQFLCKQELEAKGLWKRIQSGREEQRQARADELDRLVQRYHNVKTELQTQQKIMLARVEKNPLINGAMQSAKRACGA
jgi:hypothetical protein